MCGKIMWNRLLSPSHSLHSVDSSDDDGEAGISNQVSEAGDVDH